MSIKYFKDPIYGQIKVEEELIWNLILTPEFQRLKEIKQLGSTEVVFQGAEHTRFVHSMGVYHIVQKIIKESYIQLTKEEEILALVTALLHDIGHGPYSHNFEKIFDIHHEEYTIKIVKGNTKINKLLVAYDKNLPNNIESILNKDGRFKKVEKIISSDVDADRMDYLQRDAYNLGVTYGNFDLDQIVRTMLSKEEEILFEEKSIPALEEFLIGRSHMFSQVYLHPLGISKEIMLKKLFYRVKDLYEQNYKFNTNIKYLIPFFENKVNIEDYIILDENILNYYNKEFINEEDPILSDLSSRILNRNLFKEFDIEKKEQIIKSIEKKYDLNYYFEETTDKIKYYNLNDEPRILMKNGEIKNLSEVSNIFKALKQSNLFEKEIHKVFGPKEIVGDENENI